MAVATCPECLQEVRFVGQPDIGRYTQCEACGMGLEVVWLFPLALDYLNELNQTSNESNENTNTLMGLDHA